jgi:hypothetical protein
MHGKANKNSGKVSFISSILIKIKNVAEQFSPIEIWKRVLSMIFIKFLKGRIFGEGNWDETWWNEAGLPTNSGDRPKRAIGITA